MKRSLFSLWLADMLAVGGLSFVMSLIALSQPLYMLNLYDRVLSSQSVATLISLTGITLFLLVCMGGFDWARSLIQRRMGGKVDEAIRPALLELSIRQAALGAQVNQRLTRLEELKNFVTGGAFSSLFDLIFIPVYFAALFLFHPAIGWICTGFAVVLVLIALIPEFTVKKTLQEYWKLKQNVSRTQDRMMQGAGELVVHGAISTALSGLLAKQGDVEARMNKSQDIMNRVQAINKSIVMIVQTLILGVACYYVILREIHTGVMFAVNIVAMRALQPLFQVTASLKSLNRAAEAWTEINGDLLRYKNDERAIQPLHSANLIVRSLTVLNRIEDKKVLNNITMDLDPGELLVVTGASGAGKSTLLRTVVGLVPDYIGRLELDKRELKHWRFDRTAAFIGYLPQDPRLLDGTITENIALTEQGADQDQIVKICSDIGLHEDIVALKDGYDTIINAAAPQFSGGQLRLIALARALYGNPKMLVLDEPTSGLDAEREAAVIALLQARKADGVAILAATHSNRLLVQATKVMVLKWGMIKSYGMRDTVFEKLGMKASPA